MSDYNKGTDFAVKDSLAVDDPDKIIYGAEIDTEFTNVETALDSKFDSSDLASQGEAEAGTGNTTIMTPLRTEQHAAARNLENAGVLADLHGLADPGGDRIIFWDESADAATFLSVGAGLSITGTTIEATGIGGAGGDALKADPLSQFAATTSAQLAGVITNETGSGSLVFATSPTLVTPLLGTPTSGTLTNCTGLPIASGVSGLAAGMATFLATPSSANLRGTVTDETGSGALVFATSPTLVTPALGTPSSGDLSNCTGITSIEIAKYKTADTARIADATPADDAHLFGWSLDASSYYRIEGYLGVDFTNATGEIQMNLQTTSAFTSSHWSSELASLTGNNNQTVFASADTTVSSSHQTSYAGVHACKITGFIRTNLACTVDFQWAQANASGTSTVLAGSWIKIIKMN